MDGYYRSGDACMACNTGACESPMVREVCTKGFSRDANCICPMDQYMLTPEGGGTPTCTPCSVTSCVDPAMETLVRCPGSTNRDVSRCVSNVRGNV